MEFLSGFLVGIIFSVGVVLWYARYTQRKALAANKDAIQKRIDELTAQVEETGWTVVEGVKDV